MEAPGAVGKSSTATNNDRLVNRMKSPFRFMQIIVRTAVNQFAMYFLVKGEGLSRSYMEEEETPF